MTLDVADIVSEARPLALGVALMARLDTFAAFSEEGGALTRTYLSPAHKAASEELARWMRDAGMATRMDAAGTVIGRYEGARDGLPAVLVGSHIDTVRNAGRYDGNFGVLAGVAAVEELHRRSERLPFAVEVVAFGDEEGVRFPVTLTGSRALAGVLHRAALDARDADGVRLADALAAFGCAPERISEARRDPRDVLAYVELHIEQGPVLEAEGLPVGVVTAINGASRFAVSVRGAAGHAGTVPMELRRDALAAAAAMVLAVERCGRARPEVVATVGRLEARPGAVNVIPGEVHFSIDVRAPRDSDRAAAIDEIVRNLEGIARERGVGVSLERVHDAAATTCAPWLVKQFEAAVSRTGVQPRRLPSGAGHDAMAVAALVPVGMLFVRCRGGISHNPAEAVTVEDADVAVRVLIEFLRSFAAERK